MADVASDTGLPERYVAALERGDVNDLPDLSYARLYAQSYARVLELDTEPFLDLWPVRRAEPPKSHPEPPEAPRRLWLWAGGVAVALLVGAAFFFRSPQSPPSALQAPKPAEAQEAVPESTPVNRAPSPLPNETPKPAEEEVSSPALSSQDPVEPAEELRPDSRVSRTQATSSASQVPVSPFIERNLPKPAPARTLDVSVTAQTWLVIETDGDTAVARVASRGETFSAQAHAEFRLTVANPRAVRVQVDGRPAPLPGRTDRPLIRHLFPGKDST